MAKKTTPKKKGASKKKVKEIRTITCRSDEAQAIMQSLQEVGRARMPIKYALRLMDCAECVGKRVKEVQDRMREAFDAAKDAKGTVKEGSKKHKDLQARIEEISADEVDIEVPPDGVPVSELISREVEVTPAALETLLRHEIMYR